MVEQNTGRIYLRLLGYLTACWKQVILLFICTMIFASLSGVSLTLIPPFIHILFGSEQTEVVSEDQSNNHGVPLPGALEKRVEGVLKWAKGIIYEGEPTERLARFCIIFLILMLVKNLFGYISTYITIYLEQSVLSRIRDDLYGKIHMLPLSFFDRQKTGHLISRITNDVTNLRGAIVGGLASIIRNGLMTVMAMAIVFYTSWRLSILTIILVPL
ncbi:MAG: hypothetical protein KAX38_03835, partial [Candidatus Krumholzibacteria bacterium]|nr:hypothetical protein [Candidatus Krumholzibacteria bacterium]